MKKLRIHYAIWSLLTIALSACGTNDTFIPIGRTDTVQPSLEFTSQPLPTQTIIRIPSKTPIPTATPTTTLITAMTPVVIEPDLTTCEIIPPAEKLPASIQLPGTIFFQRNYWYGLYTFQSSHLDEENILGAPNENIFYMGASPDGQWIAYNHVGFTVKGHPVTEKLTVYLISTQGEKRQFTIDMRPFISLFPSGTYRRIITSGKNGTTNTTYWINNTTINMEFIIFEVPETPGPLLYHRFRIVFNPFTGEYLDNLMLDYQTQFSEKQWVISPEIEQALSYQLQGGRCLLTDWIDLSQKKNIFTGQVFSTECSDLFWSHDGRKLLNLFYDSAYIFDSTTKRIEKIVNEDWNLELDDGSWNTSDQTLAINAEHQIGSRTDLYPALLLFYNPMDKKFFRCIQNEEVTGRLIWSPDGEWLAISRQATEDYPVTYFLEVKTGKLYIWDKPVLVVDWR